VTTSAAFFDLDRTLMSGSSAWYFGKACYREGLRPWRFVVSDAVNGVVFKLVGASDEKSYRLRDRLLDSVAGWEAHTFSDLAPEVVEEILPRIRPEAQALLDMHASAGRDTFIVSASPAEIVTELAAALEVDGGLGTRSEVVDGRYTGRLNGPFVYGDGKAELVRSIMTDRGYEPHNCYAYSDSASDLPMMQAVGNPVAVNPDRLLMSMAHRRGWPVIEFNRQAKRITGASVAGAFGVGAAVAGYTRGVARGRAAERALWEAASGRRLPLRFRAAGA